MGRTGHLYFSALLIVLFPNLMHVYTYYFFLSTYRYAGRLGGSVCTLREAQCTKIVVIGMETQPEKSKEVFWVCGALWYHSGSRDVVLKA